MSGCIYTVCAGEDFENSKAGYTTQEVWSYLQTNYARTMVPLTIRKVMTVPLARSAESMLFAIMKPNRKTANHEVFDIGQDDLCSAFQAVANAFEALRARNSEIEKCVLISPPDKPRTRRPLEPSVNQLKKLAITERRNERIKKFQDDEKQKEELENDITRCLTSFISSKCIQGTNHNVSSVRLLGVFNAFLLSELKPKQLQVDATYFNEKMIALGFVKKYTKINSRGMQAFRAIDLKHTD